MKKLSCISVVLALLASCSNEDLVQLPMIEMPVYISVPGDGLSRAIGDPGQSDEYLKPKYTYLWVVAQYDDGNEGLFNISVSLDPSLWEYNYEKSLFANTDIYDYNGNVSINIPQNITSGSIYLVLSDREVRFNGSPATEEALKNLTFDFDDIDDKTQRNTFLKNLYSTPCNILDSDGNYYGTIQDLNTHSPFVEVICYHVAAKLDLIWQIEEPDYLTKIDVKGLFDKGCQIFNPTDNSGIGTASYTETITTDVGSQWKGRETIYIIQKNTRQTFDFDIYLNGSETSKSGSANVSSYEGSEYTPWLRGKIHYPNTTQ